LVTPARIVAIIAGVRLISTDPNEPGFLGIGQHAYGVIALGQTATGVIAIGQLARGVVAVGQLAVGLVAIGQLAFGVFAGVAMIGLFGRGFPLALIPKLPRPRQLPPTADLNRIRMGYGDGWIDAELTASRTGPPTLTQAGVPLSDVKLSARLIPLARAELGRYEVPKVVAHVRRIGQTLVCDRLLHVPVPLSATKGFRGKIIARAVLLAVLAIGVWFAIWPPIAAMWR
jgi:hypothetical protein